MKRYSIIYSKNGEMIVEENTVIDSKHDIVDLLNDKEERINELVIENKKIKELTTENRGKEKKIKELANENKKLKWYFEELRVHVSPDKLEQIDNLYTELES